MVYFVWLSSKVNDMIFLLFEFVLNINRGVAMWLNIFYTYFEGCDTKKVEKWRYSIEYIQSILQFKIKVIIILFNYEKLILINKLVFKFINIKFVQDEILCYKLK